MLHRLAAIFLNFITAMARLYTLPQLLGYALMFAAVVVISAKQGRKHRFFRRAFWTDFLHSAWFPVYTILIGVPITVRLATLVSVYVPFLRIGVLDRAPSWIGLPLFMVALDFVLYWLHRSMHRWRWLWLFHKVHHSQREINPLTTWRVHWLEFLYLGSGMFVATLFLGNVKPLHPIALGLLAASQFAQHSDIDWSYGPIGYLIVSPRFHARHHSSAAEDVKVNFGSLLNVWDYVFGTARNVTERTRAYGLTSAEDNVPGSFLSQQLFPLSLLWRRVVPK